MDFYIKVLYLHSLIKAIHNLFKQQFVFVMMESRKFLFTTIPILAIIIIFGYLNIEQEASSRPLNLEKNSQCQDIEYNGEDRIDILFISSKEEAKHYTEVLLNTEPYKSYRDYFNTRVLEEDVECEYYKDIALLCNTKKIQSISKECANDYVVVVKRDSSKIRSSAYGNLISINSVHEDSVLIHEMGHAFGNLAEEYGGAKIPIGSKNCVSSCDKFQNPIDSCEQECSESNYYRSIPTGVMRSLITYNYGKHNVFLLSELLKKNKPVENKITGNQILDETICDDNIFSIEITNDQDKVEINSDYNLEKGCVPDKSGDGDLCIGNNCYPSFLFTESQDLNIDETIQGEVYLKPEVPLVFYAIQNPSSPQISVTLNNQLISNLNSLEAGATACKI